VFFDSFQIETALVRFVRGNKMIRITKISDYGFNLLVHMAKSPVDTLFNAKGLAAAVDLPLPTISKVLKLLTQGGILNSHQGSKGGYSLVRPASEISAAEIIEALEGPIAITDCTGSVGCDRNCPASPSWKQVNRVFEKTLANLSLEDMAK
jgi:FeS assembly SUF system regulator